LKTDSLFYEIFQSSPRAFFELIGEPAAPAEGYQFVSQEVKQTSFRVDGILTPPVEATDLPIYFVEVMGYRDRKGDLYPGLFSEIFLYLNDYRPVNDWRAVVIFTRRSLDPDLTLHYRDFDNGVRLQRIYLDELPEALSERSLELGILYLIGLRPEAVPQRARRLVEQATQELSDVADQQRILELVERVCIYKFPELTELEVFAMLGLDDLKHTRVYQDGMQEEAATIALRLLNKRLDRLQPELELRIRQLSKVQLEALSEAAYDFSKLEDLEAWLKTEGK
jgi:predicted transposase YdaD